ncbi:MAG: VanW family protein [Candidatus Promineifilaceae bacterium]|nr:VanW family protein [Candidatus Promineifilaceae bacterium]
MTRNLSWFLAAPVTAVVLLVLIISVVVSLYRQQHDGRVFTGVMVAGVDLGQQSQVEAGQMLDEVLVFPRQGQIVLSDPTSGQEWALAPAELGLTFDRETTVADAYAVGREGPPWQRIHQLFRSWYFGTRIAPIFVLDEAVLDRRLRAVAATVDQPASDASLTFDGTNVGYAPPQMGRQLDLADARARLIPTLASMQPAHVELLVHETPPRVRDTSQVAAQLEQIISGPMSLYVEKPLDGADLQRVSVPPEDLVNWIRVQTVETAQGEMETQVIVDENAVRAWLEPYRAALRRDPVRARFYFDDNTRELVLVEPHINGRELDMEATVNLFSEQLRTANRSIPFVLKPIQPTAHSRATAAELNITELVSESTTWFYGSSDERKHNIARAAANFYGIVIAPGEEFSFNKFLGDVSEEQGYETGLIIFGGRTIEGVGGGVCQVSTTAFQAAFWAGYPIVERWEHGYRVGYYDDGEGPGMDATVYSPLVDFRFINDTPYHLLIENYYNEANSSLTFKFYSTSMGRTVTKSEPLIENVRPPKPDIWELDEELEPGEVEQVDWAVEGADVTVIREVFNRDGDLLRQDTFVSNYVPWQNIYNYGPGTELPESGDETAPATDDLTTEQ